MTKYDVRHIDVEQYRFLRELVREGKVEATITIRRLAPYLPKTPTTQSGLEE